MAMYQVQIVNNVKTLTPVSGDINTNSVTDNDMHPITSNAVYNALQGTDVSFTNAYPDNFEFISNLQVFKIVNNVLYINLTYRCTSPINFSAFTEIIFFNKIFTANTIVGCYAGFSPLFCYLRASSTQTGKSSLVIYTRSFSSGEELSFTFACPIG